MFLAPMNEKKNATFPLKNPPMFQPPLTPFFSLNHDIVFLSLSLCPSQVVSLPRKFGKNATQY